MAMRTRVGLSVAYPNAAGIDIGASSHFVAVPSDRDEQPVREFSSFTDDLNAIADWLTACGIDTIAMESTSVYWIPLYELLESRGFKVFLVNARHVKNVCGRKSDVLDCQWLQQLMSYGLLAGAYRPNGSICALRSIVRQADRLVSRQAEHIQHMHKAMAEMNIQLGHVISDITGKTGMLIIRAILDGERDRSKLAGYRDRRIRASVEEIERSLEGNYREEHVFALHQAVELYDAYQLRINECEQRITDMLGRMERHQGIPNDRKSSHSRKANDNSQTLRGGLYRLCGVDLTSIDGISVKTALKLLAEIGLDLSQFKSAKHFCSWLGLCPGTKISGGKVLSGKSKRTNNRAAQALKMAAISLKNSRTSLGAFFRRMSARMDRSKAITAVAHKMARIVYALLTTGQDYVDAGQDYYEERYKERVLRGLQRKAREMGFELSPIQEGVMAQ